MSVESKSDKELLLKLYELTFVDEAEHIRLGQRTLTLFTGLILAVVGGALIVTRDIPEPTMKLASFLISGTLVLVLSYLGVRGYQSNYRRQLEAIASRAKLEDLLELGDTTKFGGKTYWKEEGLILRRFIVDRGQYTDSEQFVKDRVEKGFAVVAKTVYGILSLVGVFLIGFGFFQLFSVDRLLYATERPSAQPTIYFPLLSTPWLLLAFILILIVGLALLIFQRGILRRYGAYVTTVSSIGLLASITIFETNFEIKPEFHLDPHVYVGKDTVTSTCTHFHHLSVIKPFGDASSSLVDPTALKNLDTLTRFLRDNLQHNSLDLLVITGRADKRNLKPRSARYYLSNTNLAQARAKQVRDSLVSRLSQIDISRILLIPTGAEILDKGELSEDLADDRCVFVTSYWHSNIQR